MSFCETNFLFVFVKSTFWYFLLLNIFLLRFFIPHFLSEECEYLNTNKMLIPYPLNDFGIRNLLDYKMEKKSNSKLHELKYKTFGKYVKNPLRRCYDFCWLKAEQAK